MRIVLIVQSVIILLGAYYVYTLTRSPSESTEDEVATTTLEINETQQETSQRAPEGKEDEDLTQQTDDGVIIMEGPNDLGMEFPTPDDDMLPESR